MPLTEAGRDFIASAIINDSPTFFTNANARLGAGDSTAAFDAADTDLQAASNKLRKAMEATYPQRTGNVLTFRSLFGTSEGNFNWNEWGLFNAGSGGVMLNRKVENLGTKASTQSWQLTVDLTVAIGA
ncbi:MAG: hypothetical protein ACK4UO_06265 [Pseudolabrys sp.]